jgi:hypothetical protein
MEDKKHTIDAQISNLRKKHIIEKVAFEDKLKEAVQK